MNIIFEDSITDEINKKYTLLPLDKIYSLELDCVRTAYCALSNISIAELMTLENYVDLHRNMINNYYNRNWSFCEQALEHLIGHWNGEVDTFYNHFAHRVQFYKDNDPGEDWDGVVR